MIPLKQARKRVRKHVAQATAAYAMYQTVTKTTDRLAEAYCHTWTVDRDYHHGLFDTARAIAQENELAARLGRREHTTATYGEEPDVFKSQTWSWLPMKGVALLVQARTKGDGKIVFRSPSKAGLASIKEYVLAEHERREKESMVDYDPENVTQYTEIMSWGSQGWEHRKERRSRTFRSVVVPAELQAAIEADLKTFTDQKERLERLEMPWRRGYLLSGPPGTGKTSLSLAIAGALRYNLASLSLTDIESDGELRKAVSSLRRRTVLVIEDIDAYSVSHEREHNSQRDGKLSLSGLLNSLDGFETPDGLVTICTTNHVENLDAALIRAGRLDRIFHVGYIEPVELARLFTWFYEQEPPSPAPEVMAEISPAQVAEVFKQHLDSPQEGWAAALELAAGELEVEAPLLNLAVGQSSQADWVYDLTSAYQDYAEDAA